MLKVDDFKLKLEKKLNFLFVSMFQFLTELNFWSLFNGISIVRLNQVSTTQTLLCYYGNLSYIAAMHIYWLYAVHQSRK